MITLEVRDTEWGIGLSLSGNPDQLDKPDLMGKVMQIAGRALERKRNEICCEREGHFAAEGAGDIWFCPRCMAPLEPASGD